MADATMSVLLKLAGMIDPRLRAASENAVAFGKQLPRHSENGPGDAARHAYMTAKVADLYGAPVAKGLGSLYEMMSVLQDRRAQAMDEANNAFGAKLTGLSDEELREAIIGALNEGKLRTLPNGVGTNDYARGGLVMMKGKQ